MNIIMTSTINSLDQCYTSFHIKMDNDVLFFLLRLVPKQQTAALMTSKSAWLLPE